MYVIIHQAITPDFQIKLKSIEPQNIKVKISVFVREENLLVAVTALNYMMRDSQYHDPCNSAHRNNKDVDD